MQAGIMMMSEKFVFAGCQGTQFITTWQKINMYPKLARSRMVSETKKLDSKTGFGEGCFLVIQILVEYSGHVGHDDDILLLTLAAITAAAVCSTNNFYSTTPRR